jgi:hypothetical protein
MSAKIDWINAKSAIRSPSQQSQRNVGALRQVPARSAGWLLIERSSPKVVLRSLIAAADNCSVFITESWVS